MSKRNSPGNTIKKSYNAFVAKTTNTNISLKDYVKNQINTSTPLKEVCEEWLLNKSVL